MGERAVIRSDWVECRWWLVNHRKAGAKASGEKAGKKLRLDSGMERE